ncbi:Ankyrin repeat and SOCS box protein 3 [Blyttiomyces sp. JEL0837]|nr:Ankyrin repeat and SOCS box protein 3 [Blyttiomyces sp. JEL0837]
MDVAPSSTAVSSSSILHSNFISRKLSRLFLHHQDTPPPPITVTRLVTKSHDNLKTSYTYSLSPSSSSSSSTNQPNTTNQNNNNSQSKNLTRPKSFSSSALSLLTSSLQSTSIKGKTSNKPPYTGTQDYHLPLELWTEILLQCSKSLRELANYTTLCKAFRSVIWSHSVKAELLIRLNGGSPVLAIQYNLRDGWLQGLDDREDVLLDLLDRIRRGVIYRRRVDGESVNGDGEGIGQSLGNNHQVMFATTRRTHTLPTWLSHRPNGGRRDGFTLLHLSAQGNHLRLTQTLLSLGADPECSGWEENGGVSLDPSPLFLAASNGACDVLRLLLVYGVKTDQLNVKGQTPLMRAALKGKAEAVKLLVSKGVVGVNVRVDPLEVNKVEPLNQRAAIHLAAMHQHVDTVRVLIEVGASVDIRDSEERTPLHCCVLESGGGNGDGSADDVAVKCVDVLVWEGGADVEALDRNERTPLHHAVLMGLPKCCEVLVRAGADVDAEDYMGETPIGLAKREGNVEVLQVLLAGAARGREWNGGSSNGWDSASVGGTSARSGSASGSSWKSAFLWLTPVKRKD